MLKLFAFAIINASSHVQYIFFLIIVFLVATVIHKGVAVASTDLVRLSHRLIEWFLYWLLFARVHLANVATNDLFVIQLLVILFLILFDLNSTMQMNVNYLIFTFSRFQIEGSCALYSIFLAPPFFMRCVSRSSITHALTCLSSLAHQKSCFVSAPACSWDQSTNFGASTCVALSHSACQWPLAANEWFIFTKPLHLVL